MSGEAQRKKQRLQDGGGSGGTPSGTRTSSARASWRAIPDGPLGIIAELVGPRECDKLPEAQAIRAVLPAALTVLEITSDSLRELAVALCGEAEADEADSARVTQALATQQACSMIIIVPNDTIRQSVGAAVGEALRANNACWKMLALVCDCEAGALAVLEGLQHNHVLHKVYLEGRLNADCGVALGNALRTPGTALCELKADVAIDCASSVKYLVDGVKCSRTLRSLELNLRLRYGGGTRDLKPSMEALSDVLREQQTPVEALCIQCVDVADAGGAALAEGLASNSTLRLLNLHNCDVGLVTCRALGAALARESSALCELDLSHNQNVGDAGGAALAEGLASNSTLRCLNLTYCDIGISTCRALGLVLAFESLTLCALDLSFNNKGGDAGGAALAEGLASNSTLRRLNLCHCNVGMATCRALGAALASESSALCKLNLYFNKSLGDAAGAALAEGLASNSTLQRLNLNNCNVGLTTCSLLAIALASESSALRELDLSCNLGIGVAAGAVLAEGLASNSTLRRLDLDHTCVGSETRSKISDLLSKGR